VRLDPVAKEQLHVYRITATFNWWVVKQPIGYAFACSSFNVKIVNPADIPNERRL
jgi:hypothetical protein